MKTIALLCLVLAFALAENGKPNDEPVKVIIHMINFVAGKFCSVVITQYLLRDLDFSQMDFPTDRAPNYFASGSVSRGYRIAKGL